MSRLSQAISGIGFAADEARAVEDGRARVSRVARIGIGSFAPAEDAAAGGPHETLEAALIAEPVVHRSRAS